MEPQRHNGAVRIRISQPSTGLHEYHLTSYPSDIGLESNFKKMVDIKVALDKTPRQIFLKAHIHSSGVFTCDRCVDEFEQHIENSYTMFYVYHDLDPGKYDAHEVQVISPDTAYIDLTEDIRQTIMLAVPLKLLCREECKGLCPRCGTNLNHEMCSCQVETENSHWQDLKDLLNN